jgi:hypothetical protein
MIDENDLQIVLCVMTVAVMWWMSVQTCECSCT